MFGEFDIYLFANYNFLKCANLRRHIIAQLIMNGCKTGDLSGKYKTKLRLYKLLFSDMYNKQYLIRMWCHKCTLLTYLL